MKQFTKDEATAIYNWTLSERLKAKESNITEYFNMIESIRVKTLVSVHGSESIEINELKEYPTPAAAFEAMSEKKYKDKIEALEMDLQGYKDLARAYKVSGKKCSEENTAFRIKNVDLERENATLKHNNKSIRAKNEILKETDRVVILRGAEIQKECEVIKKELKYSKLIIDGLSKSNEEGQIIIEEMTHLTPRSEKGLNLISKAKDFINNKLF